MDHYIIFLSFLPAVILLCYIYNKDKNRPEPKGELISSFFLGMLSVPLSLAISVPLLLGGFYPEVPTDFIGGLKISFLGAAIPEEIAKFIILWLFVRKSKHFDERMDGIVYAVCVSMGFAAIENLLYLYDSPDEYISTGISRALTAVPGHFFFGVLMGYYYSLARFSREKRDFNNAMILIAPILAHGIYDTLAFSIETVPELATIFTIAFYMLCPTMWKLGSKHIRMHVEHDNAVAEAATAVEAAPDCDMKSAPDSTSGKGYIPAPVDISDVQLPEELDEAVELIAKNVHEVWAKERMDEGWTLGPVRNDELKQHPCLVPYEELPEIEKEYDRNTALGTLRYIRKLGFKISKEQQSE